MNRQLKRIVDSLLAVTPEPEAPGMPEDEEAELIHREIFCRVFDLQEMGSLSFVGAYRTYRPPCGDVTAYVTLMVKFGGSSCADEGPRTMWSGQFHTDEEAEEALAAVRRRIETLLVDSAQGGNGRR